VSPHQGITNKSQDQEDNNEKQDYPLKFDKKKYTPCNNGNNKDQKIRDNIFPGDLFMPESFRYSFRKKDAAQPPFTKSTGFSIIITVRAMSAQQSEFKDDNTKDIKYDPDKTNLVHQKCTNKIHKK
jgi:hypothetical protein